MQLIDNKMMNKIILNFKWLSIRLFNDYIFILFYDDNFYIEFVSTCSNEAFAVTGAGTTNLTLSYQNTNPNQLFYSIEKSGFISTSDIDVENNIWPKIDLPSEFDKFKSKVNR